MEVITQLRALPQAGRFTIFANFSYPIMITLHDKETGAPLGQISEEDLQLLIDTMEEESTTDTDYYISSETIDMLAGDGASPTLLSLLRAALGERTGMDIAWTRG